MSTNITIIPKSAASNDLACLGILVLDVFGKAIDRFPEKGTSAYFETMEIHPGGCAYNTGVDAARLGLKVSVLGKVGTDAFGDVMTLHLKQERVDTSGVCRSAESNTAFSFVMVPEDGQRRLYHTMGVNRTYAIQDVDRAIIAASKVLHVAGAALMPSLDGAPTVELLRDAQSQGVITSLDPVFKPGIADVILPCLPHLDILLPNRDESVDITGLSDPIEQLRFYLDKGVGVVGIKLGPEGVLIGNGCETLRIGVYDVPVADTCGAGDAFVAGYLHGVVQGLMMEQAARFATATAAFCVQAVGATTAIPCAAHVETFMAQHELLMEIL